MNRRILYALIIGILIFITGCATQINRGDIEGANVSPGMPPPSESQAARNIVTMQPIEYETDEYSVYWNEDLAKPQGAIKDNYREILPVKMFDVNLLTEKIKDITVFSTWHGFSDLIIPYLLNEDSLEITDAEFQTLLNETGMIATVYSFTSGGYNHRFFILSAKRIGDSFYYAAPSYCVVQSWNEHELRAQPIFENLFITFENQIAPAINMPNKDNEDVLVFSGYDTKNSMRNGELSPIFLYWEWQDYVWLPAKTEDWCEVIVFDNSEMLQSCLKVMTDGIKIATEVIRYNDNHAVTYKQHFKATISLDNEIILTELETETQVAKIVQTRGRQTVTKSPRPVPA